MDKEKLWQSVLGELELSLTKAAFNTWLKNSFIFTIENDGARIVIGVPNIFTETWIKNKYHKKILEVLQRLSDNKVEEITYQVKRFIPEGQVEPVLVSDLKKIEKRAALLDHSKTKVVDGHGLNPRYTFDGFIVGKGNELAFAASMAISKYPGIKYNPLFLYGGVGLGKTHLLQAIGHQILCKKDTKKKILSTNAERFTNEFVKAIREGGLDKFKKKYRETDVLLMDDIQFMAGKGRIQEEFFHTFNTLHQKNSQIVLTSDHPPKAIPALEERLISRFGWGMIADISAPDFETRLAILETKAKERRLDLSEEIYQYIAGQIHSNVRELEGALNKIMAYYELNRQEPTVEIVKGVLSSLTYSPQKTLLVPRQLITAIAEFYELRVEELVSSSRRRELVVPRQIAMYLMRKELEASFPLIGQEFNRDHTTAMHAYEKIEKAIESGGKIKQDLDVVKQKLYSMVRS